MTAAPHQHHAHLSQSEVDALTVNARAIGQDLEAYLRFRLHTGSALPEPTRFFFLFLRLTDFAADYEAHLRSFPGARPSGQEERLAQSFSRLLQEWDELYGLR